MRDEKREMERGAGTKRTTTLCSTCGRIRHSYSKKKAYSDNGGRSRLQQLQLDARIAHLRQVIGQNHQVRLGVRTAHRERVLRDLHLVGDLVGREPPGLVFGAGGASRRHEVAADLDVAVLAEVQAQRGAGLGAGHVGGAHVGVLDEHARGVGGQQGHTGIVCGDKERRNHNVNERNYQ